MTYGCPIAALSLPYRYPIDTLWLQAFCISILEAVACGLRVVSTKVGKPAADPAPPRAALPTYSPSRWVACRRSCPATCCSSPNPTALRSSRASPAPSRASGTHPTAHSL